MPLLKAAWERGVTTWDTANVYSNGESERIIGKAIKEVSSSQKCRWWASPTDLRLSWQFSIPRHRLTILTKCFNLVHEDPNVFAPLHPELRDERDYVNQSGLSRAAIFNQVEASLERLGTTYIDLLQIHRADLDNVTAEVWVFS
jgi:aryl-alcohol dehydrogenase-like predicted oxidoreductase